MDDHELRENGSKMQKNHNDLTNQFEFVSMTQSMNCRCQTKEATNKMAKNSRFYALRITEEKKPQKNANF